MDLKNVEEKLLKKRSELLARVESIDADRKRKNSGALPQDFSEQAVAQENDEVLDALEDIERKEVGFINMAIDRIASGHYGECEVCGSDIGKIRLEALPYAIDCLNCAQAKE